jgi:hypothetical protein
MTSVGDETEKEHEDILLGNVLKHGPTAPTLLRLWASQPPRGDQVFLVWALGNFRDQIKEMRCLTCTGSVEWERVYCRNAIGSDVRA